MAGHGQGPRPPWTESWGWRPLRRKGILRPKVPEVRPRPDTLEPGLAFWGSAAGRQTVPRAMVLAFLTFLRRTEGPASYSTTQWTEGRARLIRERAVAAALDAVQKDPSAGRPAPRQRSTAIVQAERAGHRLLNIGSRWCCSGCGAKVGQRASRLRELSTRPCGGRQ